MNFERILIAGISLVALAGGLHVDVGNASANAEAKALNGIAVARVTECARPGASHLTASLVELRGEEAVRTALKVVALSQPGVFAILGPTTGRAVIEITATNADYKDYRSRVLVRVDSNGIQWSSLKRFHNKPVTPQDVRDTLGS
jgi:hypothetical protein